MEKEYRSNDDTAKETEISKAHDSSYLFLFGKWQW